MTLFPAGPQYTTAAETLANALALKATGEGVGTNDIVSVTSSVRMVPVT